MCRQDSEVQYIFYCLNLHDLTQFFVFFVEIEAEYAQTNKIKHHPELSKRFLLY